MTFEQLLSLWPPKLHILHTGGKGVMTSGGASAVKEPGHFEVRKSSSQVTWMHFFLKKVDNPF